MATHYSCPDRAAAGYLCLLQGSAVPDSPARIKHVKNVLKVSAVCIYDLDGRLLTVRKTGTTKFMHPGGKPEAGESAAAAGSRELKEEVGLQIPASELELLGVWTGTAANEDNTDIAATVFMAPGAWPAESVRPAAEIAELRWMDVATAGDFDDLAPLLTDYVLPKLLTR